MQASTINRTARLAGGLYLSVGRRSPNNVNGIFSFPAVSGRLNVWVHKIGFESWLQSLQVNADLAIDVTLLPSVRIQPRRSIHAVTDEPPCDPVRWDAQAPCRRFSFTPTSSGVLVLIITWHGGPVLDATMVTPSDEYLAISEESGTEEINLRTAVAAGATYEIRVNSYYAFAELRSESRSVLTLERRVAPRGLTLAALRELKRAAPSPGLDLSG